MRTNVIIDDNLISQALKVGGYKTKKAAIDAGLRLLVQLRSQQKLKKLKGKITWEGNLDEMRMD